MADAIDEFGPAAGLLSQRPPVHRMRGRGISFMTTAGPRERPFSSSTRWCGPPRPPSRCRRRSWRRPPSSRERRAATICSWMPTMEPRPADRRAAHRYREILEPMLAFLW